SCADTKGNSYSAVVDFANGSGTSGVRTVVFAARIVTALAAGNTITVSYPSVAASAVSINEFSGLGFVDRTASAGGNNGSPSCGNGVVEAAEACDDGNLANGDCCSSACTIEAAGTVCRAAAGACDVQETCTGSSATCPADAKSTAVCRPSAGICDVVESCDGVGNNCPADGFVASGTTCRAAAGVCDVAEKCTGSSASCPADAKSTAVCRAAAGICDVAESCDGVANTCPADDFAPAGTMCRAAAGVCDVAETC